MVLFDIDGTLVDSGGKGREAFIRGLAKVTGVRDELEYVSFAGNTDRNVLEQVMEVRGQRLGEGDIQRVFKCIAEELRGLLGGNPAMEIAGAGVLLARLEAEGVALGLVTGNIRECAYLKLGSAGLDGYFPFGGFGDKHADRAEIARAAFAAAREAGVKVEAGSICLVGDTPFDVAAGRAVGIPVIGVATGRYTEDDLRSAGATITVADYCDVERMVKGMEDALW